MWNQMEKKQQQHQGKTDEEDKSSKGMDQQSKK